jgi:hypothetical protein
MLIEFVELSAGLVPASRTIGFRPIRVHRSHLIQEDADARFFAPSENRGGKLLPLRSVDRRPGGDRVKKQKTDRKDAQLLRKLMMEDRFPRTWVPSPENRDLR